jgi:hypothetical protein
MGRVVRRVAAAGALAVAACNGAAAPPKAPTSSSSDAQMSALAAQRLEEAAKAPARSRLIGTLARNAMGPFTARKAEGGIVVWIVGAERDGGEELVAVATGPDGAPLGAPGVVASFPQEATSLVVRASGRGHAGWLAAYSTLLDRGESLAMVGLTPDGKARGKPMDIQRTGDHVKWVDIVPTTHGAVCVWAEETPAGEANMLTVSVDGDGKPRNMPMRVARGVVGWAAVGTDDGVGLALLTAPSESSPQAGVPPRTGDRADATTGSLAWTRLDADGRPVGAPVSVAPRSMVSGDVDVAAAHEGFLLAWTDRSGEDPHVAMALVDKTGRVRGPVRALQSLGGSMLAGLTAGEAGTVLAWEEPRGRARPLRALHLASVTTGDALSAQPMVSLEVAASPAPELASTRDGFALVASARECSAPRAAGSCRGPLQPTFVRFDSHLVPVQAERMFVGEPPERSGLAWGLFCAAEPCVALAASAEAPTPIYTVDLARRASPFAPPVMAPPPSAAPVLTGLTTLSSGKPYTDVVAAQLERTTFVASMALGPAPAGGPRDRGRTARAAASVIVQRVDEAGQAVGAPATVTSRALPAGGLALSAGGRPEDGVALGWVARDEGGSSHVHLARLDADGRSRAGLGDVRLTAARGDASDVALAWAGDGWLVAWVDSREGNGEVYATRVDRTLHRLSPEERITRAPGDAGDVSLSVAGDLAWLAWSDARESPREGVADVYVTTLRTRDARRVGDETRVLATAGHSRSPAVAAIDADAGAIVAWIEDAPPGVDAPGAAMAARVDAAARVMGAPSRIELAAEGKPTTLALELAPAGPAPGTAGRDRRVRAVIARTWLDEVTLDATWLASRPDESVAPAWPVVDLDAPGSFDVALSLTGDAIVFDDVGITPPGTMAPSGAGAHRVRRAAVEWHR